MTENSVSVPPTVYPFAPGRVWAMFGGALVFVACGAFFLVAHSSPRMVLAGGLAVPFFGLCAVLLGLRLIRRRPELVLDEAGVEHQSLGRIGWDEIAAARIRVQQVRTTSQRFVELVLHDPDAYLARAPQLVRRTAAMNQRLGFGPANIPASTLPVPLDEVLDAIQRHRPGLPVQR